MDLILLRGGGGGRERGGWERKRVGEREETERLCGNSGIVPLYVVSRSHFD